VLGLPSLRATFTLLRLHLDRTSASRRVHSKASASATGARRARLEQRFAGGVRARRAGGGTG
jgi:hypothetical protein